MEELMILRTFAAVTTVPAAALGCQLKRTHHRRWLVIFIIASIAWMGDGWLEARPRWSSRTSSSS
jgi:hypothetical protein